MDNEEKLLSYLKRTTLDLRMANRRLREMEEKEQEPLAVVGMGCRFPGGTRTPEEFWELIRSGTDAVSPFPADRGWEAWLPDNAGRADEGWAREGGFMRDVGEFDPGFFGISPREALAMDPQQRLLLEVCWEAIERAGINPRSLRGTPTGVFAGVMTHEYETVLALAAAGRGDGAGSSEGHAMTGNSASVVSGRVAYVLGLEGPAVTVDTACSSSLVALHLAGQALRSGECTIALAGGVTVLGTPMTFAEFARQGALASDGRCKSFGAGADGTGWGEGAGMVVVERLSDAERLGHRVLALVKGSAVNQDGASNGLTAPNGPSQQRVIRAALASAGLTLADVDAVEGHGTGTVLGDPIEAQALQATYGRERREDRPLWLGSVKSNIGHTQAAAGVGGVIKMVMAMRHEVLPPTLHADEPSPHVDWSAGTVRLLDGEVAWPRDGRPRRAGVSSFGISGTNAHVILEEAPAHGDAAAEDGEGAEAGAGGAGTAGADAAGPAGGGPAVGGPAVGGVVPWVVSGRGAAGLRAQAGRLAAFARAGLGGAGLGGAGLGGAGVGGAGVADAGFRLAAGRAVLEDRAVVLACDAAGFAGGLAAVAAGEPAAGVVTGTAGPGGGGRVAFVFAGQGGQWAGMAAGLMDSCPAFAGRLAECAAALRPHVEWPVMEVLRGEAGAGLLERDDVVQPALWAVMVSLAAAWEWLGVRPDAVAGHSQGEIAAACAAGGLSLADGARIVAVRSRILAGLAGQGAMLSVAWGEDTARERLAGTGGAHLAAVNGPGQVVLSGSREALEPLAAAAQAEGTRVRWLPVDYASHSPQVDRVEAELGQALAGIAPAAGRVPFYSAVTGAVADTAGLDAGYWFANVRRPVRFADVVGSLAGSGHTVFIEISPHPVLVSAITATLEDTGAEAVAAGSLRRDEGGLGRLLASAAEVFVRGVAVDWTAVFGGGRARWVELPTYAFQRQRFWPALAARPGREPVPAGGDGAAAGLWAAVERADVDAFADALRVPGDAPLSAVLPALSQWRRRRQEGAVLDGWRYRVAWEPVADPEPGLLAGCWLLVVPAGYAPAGDWARLLAGAGAEVLTVEAQVPGAGRRALAARIGQALAGPDGGAADIAGVVSLLALDGRGGGGVGAGDALAGTLVLVQALGDAGVGGRLWVVTSGAVAAGAGEVPDPVQAAVWGLGRVAALEHPRRWGGLVDVPGEVAGRVAARVAGLLAGGGGGEDQVAVREAGMLGRRLVRAAAARGGAGPWRASGVVLVTGASGALGPHIARWAAGLGAGHVVLASRRGLAAPGMAGLAARVRELGAGVSVAVCDVADRAAVAGLAGRLAAEGRAVTSVMHAAAVIALGSLQEVSLADFGQVCAAKAAGAANLDAVFSGTRLDAFVLFSSIAGVWGSGEHAAYAAANAYLDALAEQRRARGHTATSIAWGIWGDPAAQQEPATAPRQAPGTAPQPATVDPRQIARRGLVFQAPEPALAGLRQVLSDDETFIAVADVDWARFVPVFTSVRPSPLLAGVPEARQAIEADGAAEQAGAGDGGLAGRLAGLPAGEQEQVVLDLVRAEAAVVLGHASAEAVRPGAVFRDLGFDSLTAVDLRNRLSAAAGLRLPATLVFDYPTPAALAGWLRGEITGSQAAAPVVVRAGASDEPVAIVGMGCRFPGGAGSPEEFWELVRSGTDATSGLPADRGWEGAADDGLARRGGFVHEAGEFDPGFFGISPREALAMDPQQRLLLEVCWEAIERAGIDPATLRGTPAGVFVGVSSSGYGAGLRGVAAHLLTGTASSVLSGRVSYTLGLEGPAVSVDTACSSSLVALHLACQSLRSGECTMALAGGVAVMVTPAGFVGFGQQGALASDGRCKAFGAGADGMGMAEGAGMVVLERLSDARRGGHQVLAVVRGSAVNQDGASNGLTAPNGPSQQRVIRAALASAGVSAAEVDAVEGHGTGTTLGDPIEAQALLATYGQDRAEDRPLWLGSVKSNIGHAQTAAGVAGVIKMVLALRHQVLPRTLHAGQPSPHIDWSAGAVRLLAGEMPWTANGRPRRAGISAFGMSGTNAHVVLEEAPAEEAEEAEEAEQAEEETGDALTVTDDPAGPAGSAVLGGGVVAWVVSGRSAEGLAAQAGRLAGWAAAGPGLAAGDVAWSLAVTRSVFEHRAVVTGGSREELAAGLAAVAAGRSAAGAVTGAAPAAGAGRVVFVFPGQGGQWAGMGRELARSSPVFAARLAQCGRALAPYVDWSLEEALAGDGPGLERADVVQPALWAVMVSLAAAWQAAGIAPDAVVGHSQGEIAAACVAGILSLQDAAKVVALRSRALGALAGQGTMLSVAWDEQTARARLAGMPGAAIAAVNGPRSVVLSGSRQALEPAAGAAGAEGTRVRWLPVDYASHSAHVEQIRNELAAALAGIAPAPGQVPMVSAMTGQLLAGPDAGPGYWYDSLRAPVRFAQAVRALAGGGHQVFIEASPHPVLAAAITETLDDAAPGVPVTVTGTLRRDDGGPRRFLSSLAEAHVRGTTVNWAAVLPPARKVDLPTYAFQRQRYWPQPRPVPAPGGDGAGSAAEARFWEAVEDGDLQAVAATLEVDGKQPLNKVLPVLASWRRRERDRSVTASWRYRESWLPATESGPAVLSGTWLVVAPAGTPYEELALGCAQALTARGAAVIATEVRAGEADRAALATRLMRALSGPLTAADGGGPRTTPPVAAVVSLLALHEAPMPAYPMVTEGLAGSQALVQALGDIGVTAPLWMLTRGAVAAGDEETPVSPPQAQVWGLGRVAALEHAQRWGGLVDLPPVFDERAASRLCGVLAGCGEDQVAIRAGGIKARRLVRAPLPHGGRAWLPRGTVLVTGGTGAIGGHVAGWLAGRGAPRVVLASRSGPAAAGAVRLAARLAGGGTGVEVVACDTAERAGVAGLLTRIRTAGPPLSAVMHAAGLARTVALGDMTVAELSVQLAAKAAGAAHLDELTVNEDLDAFVLFSSGSATWGSGMQSGYAAANAFLDGLAASRRARGLPATSVAWGLWGGGGMGEGESGTQLRRRGLRVMAPELATTALGQALDGGEGLVVVADVDWSRFVPAFTFQRPSPLIAGLPEVQQALAAAEAPGTRPAASGADTALARRLAGIPRAEQSRVLVDLIRSEAAAVLGHSSPDAVEAGRAFRDLGFDSVTAVELRNRLGEATSLRLAATLVFDYPTPLAVAEFLRAELLGAPAAPHVTAVMAATGEPIAIVGMGCRYPGGAGSPEELWELIAAGTDAISDFPADRSWDVQGMYGPDPDQAGPYQGGFVYDAAEFDPGFFGISPREALAMDPQQRLLLEVSWEALERAGIDPASLRTSQIGVFAGAATSGYGMSLQGVEGSEGYMLTGNQTAVISGRVSYTLGLEGPAVTVDTACSSSLVALHLACQSLRSGECTMALAGGVAVMVTPAAFTDFDQQGGVAPDGRCKAFGAGADGIGWAEGAGMVVLERLSDARRGGHQVLAVVRGSAVNQDGASNGLTAPNGPSQQRVIRAALASAGVSAAEVDAVEGHGTGTTLGDPIEAQALLATYGQDRAEDRPLWLGSVKSNIGHAQTAAGVAGVIKMVLALRHQVLPRTLHAGQPSPHIDWSAGAVRLLAGEMPWTANGHPRRAGISAFGVSGTNAHAILEEAPAEEETGDALTVTDDPAGPAGSAVLGGGVVAWVVSGRSAEGLAAQAGRLAGWAAAGPGLAAGDVAWSLAVTRSVFEHRAVVTGGSREELAAGLAAVAAGRSAAGAVTGAAPAAGAGRVVFVFPGQGGQWAGMGRELARSSPVFAARLAQCGRALAPYVDWSLEEALAGDGPGLERADVVQPALWAVMVSLAAAWQAAGIAPDAVVGHSQGEIAAACVAGILSLQDAAKVVALRSRALGALAGQGTMLSVAWDEQTARARLAGMPGAAIAAVNGPRSVVLSGSRQALEPAAGAAGAEGTRVRWLPVDYASHSAHVEQIRNELAAALAGIAPAPGQVPMVSAMTGQLLAGPDAGPGYWYDSLRAPVRFAQAVRALAGGGHQVFIEASPHPVLAAAITETLDDAAPGVPVTVTGTLRRDDGGPRRFLSSLAEAHVRGTTVNWAAVLPPARKVDLPTYAFQRQRYWPQPRPAATGPGAAAPGLGPSGHPLLRAAMELADGEGQVFVGRLSLQSHPWLADHAVTSVALLPGTAFVELAIRAGDQVGCGRIEELTLEAPLVVPERGAVQIQVMLGGPDVSGGREVSVYSRPLDTGGEVPWTRHASGLLAPSGPTGAELDGAEDLAVWPPPGAVPVPVEGLYEAMAAAGYVYGPVFQGLRAAWRRDEDVFAEVWLPADAAADASAFVLHPALLDAALHAAGLTGTLARAGTSATSTVRLPFAWTGVSLHAGGACALRVRLRGAPDGPLSLVATDQAGAPVASVDSLVLRPVAPGQLTAAGRGPHDAMFSVEWVQIPVQVPAAGPAGHWAFTGPDPRGLAETLAAAGADLRVHADMAALATAVESGEPAPEMVLTYAGAIAGASGVAETARSAVSALLGQVQEWLTDEKLSSSRLVVLTQGAVAVAHADTVPDLAGAAAWGLIRSAQSENPDRLVLADLPAPGDTGSAGMLAASLATGEPELAIRGETAYGRRLARPAGELIPPEGGRPWRLDVTRRGTLDELALLACPQAAAPLEAGQVRVAVRAAGLNFRDVLIGLDMYPDAGMMGSEIAGVVLETGPGVSGLAAGDRVLGMISGGFGPVAVTDSRLLAPMPAGWSFAEAASVPVNFLTAWYALVDLSGATAGQRLLVHSAAGGVGMAAVSIARHLGLEVYGTASPGKWDTLAARGLDAAHVASSRSAEFGDEFLAATGGAGMDIVLNALAGEMTDASLRLLPRGGEFIEMGKTDVRDPGEVARRHPGVRYRSFETGEAGSARLGQILGQVVALLAAGELQRPPVRAWDVRRAREAFRFMSQARHTGKLVLTIPPDPAAPRTGGTALITGGTGTLGGLVARHLAVGGVRHAVLTSRSGPAAPGVAVLAEAVASRGADVTIAVCDASDRTALAGLLARVPDDRPLTTLVHAAGVLDDGVIGSLTPARVDAVMRPKADAAWNLHELTQGLDLEAFVLFSSAATTLANAGQGNYAAANAFLDALASQRRAAGLPAVSLAWGLWSDVSALTGRLSEGARARISRAGVAALSAEEGLALLEAAMGRDEALLVPVRMDVAGLRARAARGGVVPPLLRGLVGSPARRSAASAAAGTDTESLTRRLAALPVADRDRVLLNLVRSEAAATLGHASPDSIEPDRPFSDLGFDSLTAMELRNRLQSATGLRLAATLVFDYPTSTVLAEYLREKLSPDIGEDTGAGEVADEAALRKVLASVPLSRIREAGLMEALLRLADLQDDTGAASDGEKGKTIDALDAESLVRMAFDSERTD